MKHYLSAMLKRIFYLYLCNSRMSKFVNSKWNVYGYTHFNMALYSFSTMTLLYIVAACFFIFNIMSLYVLYTMIATIIIGLASTTFIDKYITKHWNAIEEEQCPLPPKWMIIAVPIFCSIIGILLVIVSFVCYLK